MRSLFFSICLIIAGCSAMPHKTIDLTQFTRPTSPNTYFACPAEYSNNKPDKVIKIYEQDTFKTYSNWLDVLHHQPRIEFYANDQNRIVVIQRSFLFRFPDIIQIEILDKPNNHSSFAIYSYSIYGYSDFGVNKKRVENWLMLFDGKST